MVIPMIMGGVKAGLGASMVPGAGRLRTTPCALEMEGARTALEKKRNAVNSDNTLYDKVSLLCWINVNIKMLRFIKNSRYS